ncbi:hypothetical protein A3K72_01395 [Candidatus Woesearchaeota archaeon RBG_13_36_6]|nr:MAG: hypothetical protein A3K72_01395 [Candidatus Woesearchaeota archaeon RBG_13_36_6]
MLFIDMILKGEKVYLKKGFSNKEYSTLLKWFKNIEVIAYLRSAKKISNITTVKGVKSFFEEAEKAKGTIFFGIYTLKPKRFIGYALLAHLKNKKCEFGIMIGDKSYWRKGVGSEVTRLLLVYSFDQLGLEMVYSTTSEYNKPAIRLLKSIGFKMAKKIPKDRVVYHNKKWVESDTFCMEITKQDYYRNQPNF